MAKDNFISITSLKDSELFPYRNPVHAAFYQDAFCYALNGISVQSLEMPQGMTAKQVSGDIKTLVQMIRAYAYRPQEFNITTSNNGEYQGITCRRSENLPSFDLLTNGTDLMVSLQRQSIRRGAFYPISYTISPGERYDAPVANIFLQNNQGGIETPIALKSAVHNSSIEAIVQDVHRASSLLLNR